MDKDGYMVLRKLVSGFWGGCIILVNGGWDYFRSKFLDESKFYLIYKYLKFLGNFEIDRIV